jgi:hypothetical protein
MNNRLIQRVASAFPALAGRACFVALVLYLPLVVGAAPVITTEPANATVNVGGTAVFTVVATGTGTLTYKWQLGGAGNLGSGATLTLANVTDGQSGGAYTVVVKDSTGSVTSDPPAILTVLDPPVITSQPGSLVVAAGGEADFYVGVNGRTPFSYQWKKNGSPISGATDNYLDIYPVVDGDAAGYSVVITNVDGTATSAIALLTVIEPDLVATQPLNTPVNTCTNITLSVVTNGTDTTLQYQWYLGPNQVGTSAASLTIPNVQFSDAGDYTVVVNNSAGSSDMAYGTLTVTNPPPVISGCPGDVTVTTGPGSMTCGQAATWTEPTASDNCSVISFTSDHHPNDIFSVGTTPVTYTATDSSNRTTTCTFNVIVQDTTPPVITQCPASRTLHVGGQCNVTLPDLTAELAASDNCGVVSTNQNPSAGTPLSLGTTSVTFTVADAAGNVSSPCTATITVDNTNAAPSATYVDAAYGSAPAGTVVTWPKVSGTGTHYIGCDAFATIQGGVNRVGAGGTVDVANGLYEESNIAVTNPMTIAGLSQTGVVLAPAANDSYDNSSFGGTYQYGFLLQSGSVTITNLTIDGQANSTLTPGTNNFRAGVMTDQRVGKLYNNISVQNVTLQHIYRRAIQLFSGMPTKSTGHVLAGNTVTDVTLGPGIVVFDGDATITSNVVNDVHGVGEINVYAQGDVDATGIEMSQYEVSDMVSTIQGNAITNVWIGIQTVAAAATSTIGGPNVADGNIIALSGAQDDVGIMVRNPTGTVTVQNNSVTGSAGDAGIWLFGNAAADPILVENNVLTATSSHALHAGSGTGIFMTDDSFYYYPDTDLPTYATISGNTITGFATGIYLYRHGTNPDAGGQIVEATIGGPAGQGNTITGAATGISVYDDDGAANGYNALATILNNTGSITGNAVGVDVNGGMAMIQNNDLTANSEAGIRVEKGGIVDAGDCSGGNVTGLGSSAGGNNLAGSGFNRAAPWAIENLNTAGQPGVLAMNDNFGATSASTDITTAFSSAPGSTITYSQNPLLVTCPNAVNVECVGRVPAAATDLASFLAQTGAAVSANSVTVSASDNPPIAPQTTTTRTYTISDGCQTPVTCSQTIVVHQVALPTITCPADVTVNADSGACTTAKANVPLGTPMTSDDCTVASVVNDAPASFPLGNTTVNWTVTDTAGLTATCQQTVTVVDIQPPVPVCKATTVTLDANGHATIAPADVYQSGTDNCGTVNLVSVVPSSFTYCNVGANLVTLTVNDGHGNTATCTPKVTVNAPVAPPAVVYVDAAYGASCAPVTFPNSGGSGTYYIGYNAFNTIQAGVNAVAAGGTVHVAAGTFVEQVEITKDITVQGAGPTTIIQSPATLPLSYTTSAQNKPVVYVHDTANAVVENLVVDGNGMGNANYRFMGVSYYRAGGLIESITVKGVRDNPIDGMQAGNAIYAYADASPTRNLEVSQCTVLDFQKNGITINGSYLVGNVHDNIVTGAGPVNFIAQNGIQFGYGATGVIANNEVSGFSYTPNPESDGILIYQAAASVTNNIAGNCDTGVEVYDPLPGMGVVQYNNVANNGYGVSVDFDTGTPFTVNAQYNWWGSPSGPVDTANPDATGSPVSGTTVYSPWLGDSTDTSPAIGFQPNLTPVYYPPDHLAFSTQPGGAGINSPLSPQPVVQVIDSNGGLATVFNGTVTIVLGNDPSGGTLSGGLLTLPVVGGVATFSGLQIDRAGASYSLVASSASPIVSATSNPFDISNPLPSITSLVPDFAVAGDPAFPLTINGANFVYNSTVNWNGTPRATTFVNSGTLTAAILASDISSAGTILVTVTSQAPGGGTTSPQTFTINGVPMTVWVSATYSSGGANDGHLWGYDAFNTVQAGVNRVGSGGTVNVAAGTYAENVTANKPVMLLGANQGITGCGARGSESIISGGAGIAIDITSDGVTVDGFNLTGATGLRDIGHVNVAARNNLIYAVAIGADIEQIAGSVSPGLTVERNCITLAGQLAGTTPTIGIAVLGTSGSQAPLLQTNGISGAFYGHLLYANAASVPTTIRGGTITGVMQGVAVFNLNPQTLTSYAPSSFLLDSLSMSGFTGNYPSSPNNNIQAGVYVFTGGSVAANNIIGTITNVTVTGAGKIGPDSAGMDFADFSTATAVMQQVSVQNCSVNNNANRGIFVSGANAAVSITGSTLSGNGFDPYGAGGNNGYGIIARNNSQVTVTQCFITNPATVTAPYTVTAVEADANTGPQGPTLTVSDCSLNNNGNASGKLAGQDAGTLNASGNWWGSTSGTAIAGLTVGTVDFTPYLDSGTDTDLNTPGFQGDFSTLHVTALGAQTGSTGRIQEGINLVSGGTVYVHGGPYTEGPQILVNKNVTVIGDGMAATVLQPAGDTGNSGDSKGWWLVQPGMTFNLSQMTLNGAGHLVYQAIRSYGLATIDHVHFTQIQYNASGPDYAGFGVVGFDNGVTAAALNVSNCQLDNIGREGVFYFGNTTGTCSGNSYTGKGPGNWLDYAVEVGGGAQAVITGNNITGNTGVASVDGSTSAGVIVSTYYGPGTTAKLDGNTIRLNTDGVDVGYSAPDTSQVLLQNNDLTANANAALSVVGGATLDAGQCGAGASNVTGLGISAGANNFSGYLAGTAKAIVNDNLGGAPAVLAFNDIFGATALAPAIANAFSGTVLASQTGGLLVTPPTAPSTWECVGTLPPGVTTLADYETAGGQVSATVVTTISSSDSIHVYDGIITRTYTLQDPCGQTATPSQMINIHDATSPQITTCPASHTLDVGGSCTVAVPDMTGEVMVSDNCGANLLTITQNPAAGTPVGPGTTTVTMTATDKGNNQATCPVVLTIKDVSLPVITCPANVTVTKAQSSDPYFTGTATATDNCTASPTITYNDDRSGLTNCDATGVIVRTWTATDAAGNASTCPQTITVIDTSAPQFVTVPANITTNNDPGLCSAVVTYAQPTAEVTSYSQGFEDPNWVSGDYVNNPLVDWNDYDSHVSRVPGGTDGIAASSGLAYAVIDSTVAAAQDNNTGAFCRLGGYSAVFGAGFRVAQDVYVDLNDPNVQSATDSSGYAWDLSAAASQQDGSYLRDFIFHAAAYDKNGVVVAASNNSGDSAINRGGDLRQYANYATLTNSGWYTFEWIFRNNAGVLAVDLKVRDAGGTLFFTQTLSNPGDLIPSVVGGNRYLWFTFINADTLAIDNTVLERFVPVSTSIASGSAFPVGTNTVVCTATDACSNSVSTNFTVIVNDTEKPTAICPANVVQGNDPGLCSAVVSFNIPSNWDNCGIANVVATPASGSVFPVGTTPVAVVVTDIHGNTNACSFTVTVNDTEKPTAICPVNIVQSNDPGLCSAVVSFNIPSNWDNCGIASVVATPASGSIFPVGTNLVTVVVTDIHGNSNACSFTVTVNDTEKPTITAPAAVTVNTDPGACSTAKAHVTLGTPTTADNCGVASVVNNAPDPFPKGSTTVIWTVTDTSGNQATATQTVTVQDHENPTITAPATVTVPADTGVCYASLGNVNLGTPTTADNCGVAGVVNNAPAQFPVGTNLVTWTVSDTSGNTNTAGQLVIVVDTQPPTITCPANVTVTKAQSSDPAVTGTATATDNCTASPAITYNDNRSGLTNCDATGVIVRTWTATDAAGNSNTCAQIITVIDTSAPQFVTVPADITTTNDPGLCTAVVTYAQPRAEVTSFSQGFEDPNWVSGDYVNNPSVDWNDYDSHVSRVLSGTGGIAASSGLAYAVIDSTVPAAQDDNTGAFCRLGGYSSVFGTGFRVAQDVYVNLNDPSVQSATASSGYAWDLDAAASQQDGSFLRDFIFHAAAYDASGVVIAASNNSTDSADNRGGDLRQYANYATLTNSGWYTFEWIFRNNAGVLAVDLKVRDASGALFFTNTLSSAGDLIPSVVGGNRYLWFTFINADTLAIDNTVLERFVPVSTSIASGSAFPVGTNTVVCTATDACGNSVSTNFTVIVNDTQPPTIACPGDITTTNDLGQCGAIVSYVIGTGDNCGVVSTNQLAGLASGSRFPVGKTTNTFQVADAAGNTATCSFVVTVVDDTPPTANCPTSIVRGVDAGMHYATVSFTLPANTDNCGVASTVAVPPSGSQFPVGTNTVTVVVTDVNGNTNTCAFTVAVIDVPLISGQPASVNNNAGTAATFTVVASSPAPFGYQWRKNGTAINGATTSVLTLNNVRAADQGSYSVVVTNFAGSSTSSDAVLTVVDPYITVQPVSVTNVLGGPVSFSDTAVGTAPLSYQWQQNGASLIGATTSTYSLASIKDSDSGSYQVIVTNLVGSTTSLVATLTITHPPVISQQPTNLVVNLGQTAVFSVGANGSTPFGYQWFKNGIAISGAPNLPSYIIPSTVSTNSGTYSVLVTNLYGQATSASAVLTVVVPPTITSEPVGLTNNAGTTASFSVTNSGSTSAYYWYKNGTNLLSNGGKISGSATNVLTITNVLGVDTALYSVVVSNQAGMVASTNAPLLVIDPIITAQPSSATANLGAPAGFAVGAYGTSPAYQWRHDGSPIANATAATYSIVQVTDTDAGSYDVVVTNAYGAVTSAPPVTLTVIDPALIVTPPTSLTLNAGQTATFTVSAGGTAPLAYQWYKNGTIQLSDTGNILGSGTATLTISGVSDADVGSYTVVVTNVAAVATSSAATLTVIDPPVLASSPESLTRNAGQTAAFTASASGSAATVVWTLNGNPVGGAVTSSSGTGVTGSTTSTLTVTASDATAGTYVATFSNAAGTAATVPASLTVIDPPVLVSSPASLTRNAGQTAAFTASASGSAATVVWTLNGNPVGGGVTSSSGSGVTGSTTSTLTVTASDATAGSYVATFSNAAGTAATVSASLTVIDPPVITAGPVSRTNNAITTATFSVTATGTSPTYQWFMNTTNLLTDSSKFAGATTASLNISNVLGADRGEYSVVISNAAGVVTSTNAELTVIDPAITAQPLSITNADGGTVTFSVTAVGTQPLSYQWQWYGYDLYDETNSTLVLADITDSDAGIYTVVVSNGAGTATSSNAVLVTVPPLIVTQPASLTVNQGQPASFSVDVNGQNPFAYQWQQYGTNIASATNRIFAIASALAADAGPYLVIVSNPYGTETSRVATLTVLLPQPVLTIVAQANWSSGYPTLQVGGTAGFKYALRATTNFTNWTWLWTNTAPYTFVDTNAVGMPHRFYRAQYIP